MVTHKTLTLVFWVRLPISLPIYYKKMNIFATSDCPRKSAQSLCNKHIIKMGTESVSMLAHLFPDAPIKPSHKNHPASIWVRKSLQNYEWLLDHGHCICDEYKSRYKREHKSKDYLDWFSQQDAPLNFEYSGLTSFPRCFSSFVEELKPIKDTHEAYRQFYFLDKKDFAKWPSLEKIPSWWSEKSEKFIDKSFVNGIYSKR